MIYEQEDNHSWYVRCPMCKTICEVGKRLFPPAVIKCAECDFEFIVKPKLTK